MIVELRSKARAIADAPSAQMGLQLKSTVVIVLLLSKARANAIAPSYVRTEINKTPVWSDPVVFKEVLATIPLGRIAEPDDIASVALFLASDASRHITGETIVVDGGEMA